MSQALQLSSSLEASRAANEDVAAAAAETDALYEMLSGRVRKEGAVTASASPSRNKSIEDELLAAQQDTDDLYAMLGGRVHNEGASVGSLSASSTRSDSGRLHPDLAAAQAETDELHAMLDGRRPRERRSSSESSSVIASEEGLARSAEQATEDLHAMFEARRASLGGGSMRQLLVATPAVVVARRSGVDQALLDAQRDTEALYSMLGAKNVHRQGATSSSSDTSSSTEAATSPRAQPRASVSWKVSDGPSHLSPPAAPYAAMTRGPRSTTADDDTVARDFSPAPLPVTGPAAARVQRSSSGGLQLGTPRPIPPGPLPPPQRVSPSSGAGVSRPLQDAAVQVGSMNEMCTQADYEPGLGILHDRTSLQVAFGLTGSAASVGPPREPQRPPPPPLGPSPLLGKVGPATFSLLANVALAGGGGGAGGLTMDEAMRAISSEMRYKNTLGNLKEKWAGLKLRMEMAAGKPMNVVSAGGLAAQGARGTPAPTAT